MTKKWRQLTGHDKNEEDNDNASNNYHPTIEKGIMHSSSYMHTHTIIIVNSFEFKFSIKFKRCVIIVGGRFVRLINHHEYYISELLLSNVLYYTILYTVVRVVIILLQIMMSETMMMMMLG